MSELPSREIEAFLVLAEELHFGRAGERLFVSQSRVSQLLNSFEQRIGTRLVDRSSRRVALTEFGAAFHASLAPAHRALTDVVAQHQALARRSRVPIRVGFQGVLYPAVAQAIATFEHEHELAVIELRELPLGDPFSDVLAHRVDAAVALLPVSHPEIVTAVTFSQQPQVLAVSTDHPFAHRQVLDAEELADTPLIPILGPAPEDWQRLHSPTRTPAGVSITTRGGAHTIQEGLSQVAAGTSGLVLCAATAAHSPRSDIRFIPVPGLPESVLGLIWRVDHETPQLRDLATAVRSALAGE